jgi:hypothetical protein
MLLTKLKADFDRIDMNMTVITTPMVNLNHRVYNIIRYDALKQTLADLQIRDGKAIIQKKPTNFHSGVILQVVPGEAVNEGLLLA